MATKRRKAPVFKKEVEEVSSESKSMIPASAFEAVVKAQKKPTKKPLSDKHRAKIHMQRVRIAKKMGKQPGGADPVAVAVAHNAKDLGISPSEYRTQYGDKVDL